MVNAWSTVAGKQEPLKERISKKMRLKRIGPEGESRKEKPGFSPKVQGYIDRAMARKRAEDEAQEEEASMLAAAREARQAAEAMNEGKPPESRPRTLLSGLPVSALKLPSPESERKEREPWEKI
jgi:hypothetical protein